jgi:peptidyl-Lys metalloendopeptidase
VKYSPSYVVKKNKESSFTILAPGQSVDVTHDCKFPFPQSIKVLTNYPVGAAYNFVTSGARNYKFEASNLFHYVNDAGEVVELRADNEATNLKVAGVLSAARNSKPIRSYSPALGKRAFESIQESGLNDAISAAENYASGANS